MPLKIHSLSVSYGSVVAVRSFDIEIEPGEVVAVIGPNGAGKTSLLAAIGGQVAHRGSIEIEGRRIEDQPPHKRCQAGVGFVPSSRGVFPALTVREHIRIAAGRRDKSAWDQICKLFPIIEQKQASLGSDLSGGQQQLVSISRAMATSPSYILMDEPSIGLSPIAIGQLTAAVKTLTAQNVGVLLSEQNAALALGMSDYCYLMVRGEVRLEGTPSQLKNRPEVEALYLGRFVGVEP